MVTPVKNLVRMNWMLPLVFSLMVFLFLFHDERPVVAILYMIMTALAIGLIGFADTAILLYLSGRYRKGSAKFKTLRYVSTYTVSLAIYLILWPIFAAFVHKAWSYRDLGLLLVYVVASAIVNSLVLLLQDFILLQEEKAQADLEFSRLKTAHAEAANLLLKQQIHPHFLFNALNTVKALYRVDIGQGDAYLVHLANFLRASVFNRNTQLSTLEEELSFLNDYLEMQKIRFGAALDCTVDIPKESLGSRYLLSFSLQPLVENAIKHNELTEEAPLAICIQQRGDRIVVSNNLQSRPVKLSSAHYGLANLSERYRLWSGDEVVITQDPTQFSVSLKLLTS